MIRITTNTMMTTTPITRNTMMSTTTLIITIITMISMEIHTMMTHMPTLLVVMAAELRMIPAMPMTSMTKASLTAVR